MKNSIMKLSSKEIEEISGGWTEKIPEKLKETAKIILLVSGPFIGFAVGIGTFLACTKPVKMRKTEDDMA